MEIALLPKPPKLKKIIGPSFLLLSMGLGSGELLMWPFLVSNWGLGIIWGAALGITLQFFLNMEIERYTLIYGESIFVGLNRKFGKIIPWWFILSTLIPWVWPGIVLSSAVVIGRVFGINNTPLLATILLLIAGGLLSFGRSVYKVEESFQKFLIIIGIPLIVLIVIAVTQLVDYESLIRGLVGIGEGYRWVPKGVSILSFLGAFAYSGAGGNLNLAQSFYIKEKEYGMGKYGSKISGMLENDNPEKLEGKTFEKTSENLRIFNKWWRLINIEHGVVFWLIGLISILLLAILSFSLVYPNSGFGSGLGFLFEEAKILGLRTVPIVGTVFLIIVGLMLYSTQVGVLDATSRILAENLAIVFNRPKKIKKYFFSSLWLLIAMNIIIVNLKIAEPLQLVTISAVLNGMSMMIYSALILWFNSSQLEKPLQPKATRKFFLIAEIFIMASLFIYTVANSY